MLFVVKLGSCHTLMLPLQVVVLLRCCCCCLGWVQWTLDFVSTFRMTLQTAMTSRTLTLASLKETRLVARCVRLGEV